MKSLFNRQRLSHHSFYPLLLICCLGSVLAACGVSSTTANVGAPNATATATPATNSYGSGITCGAEDTAVHYHANLQISVNGKNEPLPALIGFGTDASSNECLYWLHTHTPDGVIHIEAPTSAATRQFTLGDFFAIWALTPTNSIAAGPPQLTATSFFGLPIDAQHPLTIYVDGKQFTGDPNTIVLTTHENIWMEYGLPLVAPTPYQWPQGE